MAIKSIEICNVMVFHESFRLDFCDGINVLIGENGVGKTTVLKMLYAASQWSNETVDRTRKKRLLQFFSNNLKDSSALKNSSGKTDDCFYKVSDGTHFFKDDLYQNGKPINSGWLGLNIQSVFIPTTEMLSHSKGFLALNQKYNMPFDETQIDIIVNASLPETRKIPAAMEDILNKISAVIDGEVIVEDDLFYVIKKDGRKVDFSLEAEGLRKLGLLWKLIRNGMLEKDAVLFWDEPEANLNPELYPLVAEILLALQKNGVQIFIATHSYNFAKYLEIRRTDKEQVMFHNLYKKYEDENRSSSLDYSVQDDAIYSQSAYRMEEIEKNHIMIADNRLLDEVYDM